jgi:hypothetical protein
MNPKTRKFSTFAVLVLAGTLSGVYGQPPPAAKKPKKVTPPASTCEKCGTERWDIKTLSDSAESSVNFTPENTTVAALTSLKAPTTPAKRNPDEQKTYHVRATLVGYKQEFDPGTGKGDHDFHIVIADLADPTKTMVVEIPDSACSGVCTSPKLAEMEKAREDFLKGVKTAPDTAFAVVHGKVEVEVTGVGFFDFAHGQTGLAPNCVELHPVIAFSFPSGQQVLAVHGHGPAPLPKYTCIPQAGGGPKPATAGAGKPAKP